MKTVLLVSLAGMLGTLSRYLAVKALNKILTDFPWGTLFVNVLGAFIAGFCYILCKSKFSGYEEYFPVLFIGFLGAFTTFSTFALESAGFIAAGEYGKFFLNVLLQNVSGLAAAVGGFYLAKLLFSNLN